ncbi:MAG: hypothetical protein AAF610_04040 [Pseudomonadota bacterium]
MSKRPFYVGYQPNAPVTVGRYLRPRLLGVIVIAALVAVLIPLSASRYAASGFEFGTTRMFAGVLSEHPYPTLLVPRPGKHDGMPYSRYLLVAPGKFGLQALTNGLKGRRVELQGTVIHRDDHTMIEVVPESLKVGAADATVTSQPEALGNVTLRGEIVDSKCYLGLMKPSTRKPHKACAIRCLAGGIPAILVVTRPDGGTEHVILSDLDGRALNNRILDRVAEPVVVTGALTRRGGDLILMADPGDIRRVASGPADDRRVQKNNNDGVHSAP